MNDKPDIERIRVLHDVQTHFELPNDARKNLESQLSSVDQDRVERFVSGFKIEDWFEWIFCAMPWAVLIHGLDQQQFPTRSKSLYQVPDFLMLVETTALTHQPLLVEVKRVQRDKTTLKLASSQVSIAEAYAESLGMPIVYVVYWEKFNVWTVNTPDTLNRKSSSAKLPLTRALEFDCSLILGDVSYFLPQSLQRTSLFDKSATITDSSVRHTDHGAMVCDSAKLGDRTVELEGFESAAIDCALSMIERDIRTSPGGQVQSKSSPSDNYMIKLSTWITRHLAIFDTTPSETLSNGSAHAITELMEKLGCPKLQMFPTDRSFQIQQLATLFMTPAQVEEVATSDSHAS
ncbi:hypothetical protein [Rubripirellula reticaptiva]|uniref:Uncharacterized protein n=1 Tax=Rubripirellula reticaptiva TaxID=2528013 RepID=A0A5C6ESQ6_9BACT|nr:hypothetical protein [Rubripirellula reticaptiva]TWU51685.1 hypothetical protein Poly59_32800 [Rubripirellula reticaptiva]